MSVIKSIFSWLGTFLTKTRVVMLNLVTALVLILITVAILGGIFSSYSDEASKDPAGRVLILNPKGTIVDQEVFATNFNFGFNETIKQIQTRDLIALIQAASKDEDIPAIYIDFSQTSFAGPTTAINIAKELKALRDSGKRIIAFSDRLSTASYMMASQATEVWVHLSAAYMFLELEV